VFFAITGIFTWLIAIAIGAVVGAAAVIVAKHIGRKGVEEVPEDATDLTRTHAPAAAPARAVTA
jgi:PTS system fructose-specific IIC component